MIIERAFHPTQESNLKAPNSILNKILTEVFGAISQKKVLEETLDENDAWRRACARFPVYAENTLHSFEYKKATESKNTILSHIAEKYENPVALRRKM